MFVRPFPSSPTLSNRFHWLLQCLYDAVGYEWRRRGIGHPLQAAISGRFIGLVRGLNRLFVKWEAGTLRPPPARMAERVPATAPPGPFSREEGEKGGGRASAWGVLPRRFGWLRRLLPEAAGAMHAFADWLADPEVQAMAAAAPQVGRILRPFCHFIGLETPEWLRLPGRVREATENISPPPPRQSGGVSGGDGPTPRGRRRTPREMAKAAMEWSRRTGKPIDPKKLGSVAYGYVLHWPRDEHSVPPEIGYAPSRWRAPKDHRPAKDWE